MERLKEFFEVQYPNEHAFNGTLFYDETNNFRKFYLREGGWNSEALNIFFVLGGIVLENGKSINVNDLLTSLHLQKNSKEIKFNHLTGKSNEWTYSYGGSYAWNASNRPCMAQIIGWNQDGTITDSNCYGKCDFKNMTLGQKTHCSDKAVGKTGQ